ncbi:1,4-dihydroxy-2-naphthoyl-CoA hydrolase [Methylobacterium crusticola]|uniref:1,4-dihydroxy-2-naphthoyl-CoA hydrolase n=1 Tax=Methylobacterium crusticola TaxID=1697972 RepID=A0ABQ4R7D9_9HYPH|nr:PaaI family thioesterase [Methylobacterium crusticola]GJD53637.1 1,4-dihydroxy-2-naphthoyl-CoA hydrolase [Methylobacterium crusticola]
MTAASAHADRAEAERSRHRSVTWSDPRAIAAAAQGRDGLAFLRALVAGEVPPPPIVSLLGIALAAAETGCVTMRLPAGEHLYNPIGTVHGGVLATLLDSVMGCAVHSTLPAGRGYTTLEIKVNYLRAVTEASGTVTAVGRIIHAGRRQAVAEASLTDAAGRLCATASTTCLVFDHPAR